MKFILNHAKKAEIFFWKDINFFHVTFFFAFEAGHGVKGGQFGHDFPPARSYLLIPVTPCSLWMSDCHQVSVGFSWAVILNSGQAMVIISNY